jgi:hypothetical protein
MQSVELTFGRAFKVWWSYSWRAFVLALLVVVPLEIVMFWYMRSHLPKQGANPADAVRVAGTMAAAWPILMAVVIALQAQAMRWMLNKARWSDFRVALLPRDQ